MVSCVELQMQPAYQDADSTSTALQAAAPVGVTAFRTERLVLPQSAAQVQQIG